MQNGDALVRAALIFARDVEKDVLPTVAPVIRQTFFYALRALCEQEKRDVPPLIHDLPRFTPPRIGLLQKEIGRHAHAQLLAAFYFVVARADCRENTYSSVRSPRCTSRTRATGSKYRAYRTSLSQGKKPKDLLCAFGEVFRRGFGAHGFV